MACNTVYPSQTPALTGKIPRRYSRSWLPLSPRGDRCATAHRALLSCSRLPTFETRQCDGTALQEPECNIDDHIPDLPACTKSKVFFAHTTMLEFAQGGLEQLRAMHCCHSLAIL